MSSNRFALAEELPLLLTVEEAAAVLRIGRTLAYSLTRRYEESGGVAGLPVIRFGGCLRVPRSALLELARTGRVVALTELVADASGLLDGLDDESPIVSSDEPHQLPKIAEVVASEPKRPKRAAGAVPAARVDQQLALLPSE